MSWNDSVDGFVLAPGMNYYETQFVQLKNSECLNSTYISCDFKYCIICKILSILPFAHVDHNKPPFSKTSVHFTIKSIILETKIKFPVCRSVDLPQSIHFLLTLLTPIIAILTVKWCSLIMIPTRDWWNNESIDFTKCSKCMLFIYSKWIGQSSFFKMKEISSNKMN